MRTQLVAAFEESLHAAPNPGEVLAGVRAGIRRRRRRARIRTVAGAVLLAVLASTVAISLARDRSDPPVGRPPNEEWRATVQAGWVPGGMVSAEVSSGLATEGFVYRSSAAELTVSVEKLNRNRNLDQPGWRRLEINGRPAAELGEPGAALVVLQLPSGRWADVRYAILPGGAVSDLDLRVGAEQVARSLREGVDLPVRVDIAPGYLPDGLRVVGVSTDPQVLGRGTVFCAGGPRSPDWVSIAYTLVDLLQGSVRIADIQGRPAYLVDEGRAVVVNIYHGGMLAVSSVGNPVPVEELIKVAEGVRWIG